jgi:1-acyl-sn-glycerol-3-phosphate acyltransferase
VGLTGTEHIQPLGSTLPRLAHVTVRFGQPLSFADRYDGVPTGRARREVTDVVMDAIQQQSGQQFAGVYNERPADT